MKGKFRWFVVLLLFLITIINYIDRSAIAFAINDIQTEFGLTPSQVGLILGAFGIGYIISTLLGGLSVDRYGSKFTLAGIALLWTIATGWTGLATGFFMLISARAVLGVAEGPSFPAVTGAIERWLPPEESATALAGALVAVPIALAIGSPIVSQLILLFEWRTTFFILAALVVLWLPFWLYFYTDNPTKSKHLDPREMAFIESHEANRKAQGNNKLPSIEDWKILLTTPTLLANFWAYFVFGYFLFFFMTWMPEYLRKSYELDLSKVGLISILPWAASAVALYGFGLWSDHILKRTGSFRKARSYQIAGTQLIAAIAIVPVALTDNLQVAVIGITVAVTFSMAANSAYYAVITDLVPQSAGTAMGIMTIFFAAAGFLAPAVTGVVLTLTDGFAPAFLLMAVLAFSSVLGILIFHHPDRDRHQQKESTPEA